MRALLIGTTVISILLAEPAAALLVEGRIHSVTSEFLDPDGNVISRDTDREIGPFNGIFTETLRTFIGGSRFEAAAGMAPSGLYGVNGHHSRSGTLRTSVRVVESLSNPGLAPIEVTAGFIITDGLMQLAGNENSSISFDITVLGGGIYTAGGTLQGTPGFATTFTPHGDDIGATYFPNSGTVTFPFSVQRVNLGALAPGDDRTFSYSFAMTSIGDGVEIARFQFSDPPNVNRLVAYDFNVVNAVPSPSSGLLLGTALMALTFLRRR